MKPAYCDYLLHLFKKSIHENKTNKDSPIDFEIKKTSFDLNENGAFVSTKKKMFLTDKNGLNYLITIEEIKYAHPDRK